MNRTCTNPSLVDRLGSAIEGEGEIERELEEHLEDCLECQQRIEHLAAEEEHWHIAREALPTSEQLQSLASKPDEPNFRKGFLPHGFQHQDFLSPPSHPELLGRIGRYDVERLIGSGGMGVVFKAHDSELRRSVAIKFLSPHLSEHGSARKRFAREARAAAAVMDEHVVAIHNVESGAGDGDSSFLVMEYIAGGSLQQRLDRDGPMDVCEILRVGMHTARGLAAAHAQGLIHRDVKPSNILLDEGVERALLTDFGLARAEDEACLTRSGMQPGTPHYMSPEQVRGEAIDARSDLFSLGCVLYAMCTGHPPFRAETSYAVLRRITDEEPRSIRELNPEIPAWMEGVILKLLCKQPVDRGDSAAEVADLLEGCLAHAQSPSTEPLPENASMAGSTGRKKPPIGKMIAYAGFGFSLIFAAILIVLELNKGTLKIVSDADGVPVKILKGDRVVEDLVVDRSGNTIRVSAGQYTVVLKDDFESLDVQNDTVILGKRDEKTVRIVRSESKPIATASAASTKRVFAAVAGTIKEVMISSNQRVAKGDLLLELRNLDLELELTQVNAQIESTEQSIRLAENPGLPGDAEPVGVRQARSQLRNLRLKKS